jgi:hypothetical protein
MMPEPLNMAGSARASGRSLALTAFCAAFLSVGLGLVVGSRWFLPAANALAIYPFYIRLVLAGRRRQAVVLVLLWALFMSQAVIVAATVFPNRTGAAVMSGPEYKGEMFSWISTGEGKESSPRQFIPEHARDLVIFALLALVTGGFGALVLGAVLLNYMNFYVAQLLASADHPVATAFLAWQPYAIIRVVAYIILATALTEIFLAVAVKRPARWDKVVKYAAAGVALALADVIIKAFAAPLWAAMLRWSSGL